MTSIESMPDELWLLFMSFSSPIHLCRALFGLNRRVNALLRATLPRLVIDTSDHSLYRISYTEWLQLVENEQEWCRWLLSSLHNVRLGYSLLRKAHQRTLHSPILSRFSSLRRLCIQYMIGYEIEIVNIILSVATTLHDFRLIFQFFVSEDAYFQMIHMITDHRLSLERMAFEMMNGEFVQRQERDRRVPRSLIK